MMTKRILRPLQFAAVAVLVIVCGPAPRMRAQSHDQHPASLGSVLSLEQKAQQNAFIRAVREATQPYQTADMLPRDYQLQFGCVSGGDFGAMGMHYVNLNLVGDGEITISKPEIMLYEPVAGGRPKLTGVDYLVIQSDWDAKHPGAPPEFMGQLFHLFESPNRFGLPAFYTLHVWAWKDNPNGTFSNWNPNVSCDAYNGGGH